MYVKNTTMTPGQDSEQTHSNRGSPLWSPNGYGVTGDRVQGCRRLPSFVFEKEAI